MIASWVAPSDNPRVASASLRELDLSGNCSLGFCHVQPLGLALANSTTLAKLRLSNCRMRTEFDIRGEDGELYPGPSWIAVFVEGLLSSGAPPPVEDIDVGNGADYSQYVELDQFEAQVLLEFHFMCCLALLFLFVF